MLCFASSASPPSPTPGASIGAAAIATSARYLRVYSHTGAQRAVLCIASPLVSLVGMGGTLVVITHSGRAANADDQALTCAIFDMRDPSRPVRLSSSPLPLSDGATLTWAGFSEGGSLTTVDSKGVVRSCLRSNGYEWVPLCHTEALKKSAHEHHWVVGVNETQLMCVIVKGDDPYPSTLPRPVLSALPLTMPQWARCLPRHACRACRLLSTCPCRFAHSRRNSTSAPPEVARPRRARCRRLRGPSSACVAV